MCDSPRGRCPPSASVMGHLDTAGWTSMMLPLPLSLASLGINEYISDMGLWQCSVGLAGEVQELGHTCLLSALPLPTGYTSVILPGSHRPVQTGRGQ